MIYMKKQIWNGRIQKQEYWEVKKRSFSSSILISYKRHQITPVRAKYFGDCIRKELIQESKTINKVNHLMYLMQHNQVSSESDKLKYQKLDMEEDSSPLDNGDFIFEL